MKYSDFYEIYDTITIVHINYNYYYSSSNLKTDDNKLICIALKLDRKSRIFASCNQYKSKGPCRLVLYH